MSKPTNKLRPENTIVSFKEMAIRDLIMLERRVGITTDPVINKNKKDIMSYINELKKLINEIPTT